MPGAWIATETTTWEPYHLTEEQRRRLEEIIAQPPFTAPDARYYYEKPRKPEKPENYGQEDD